MSMLEEVEKFMADAGVSASYRTINLGGKFLYVEGIKSVISFGQEELLFQLKTQVLSVVGVGLKIKYLDKSSCAISGQITKVEVK